MVQNAVFMVKNTMNFENFKTFNFRLESGQTVAAFDQPLIKHSIEHVLSAYPEHQVRTFGPVSNRSLMTLPLSANKKLHLTSL